MLTVKQPYPHGRPESFVLVRCGAPDPELSGDLARAQRITVPVASLYSASITQLGMITELNRADVVTGVADPADVVDPQLRQRISSGKTVGYGPGQQVNVERVIAAHPDVLVTSGTDESGYPKLRDAGVNVVADAEWLEATPLGRAEWIKVLAALTGTEKKAAELYGRLRGRLRHPLPEIGRCATRRSAARNHVSGQLGHARRRRLRGPPHPGRRRQLPMGR